MIEIIGPALLFFVGLYAVAIKKDLVRMVIGIIIMEFSLEPFLVAMGEKRGLTVFVGLAAVILLIALTSQFKEKNVDNLKELKG